MEKLCIRRSIDNGTLIDTLEMTGAAAPLFLVGTRFQAMMVQGIVRHLGLAEYDLVIYHQRSAISPDDDFVLSALMCHARRVSRIDRCAPTRRQFAALLRAAGRQNRTVFLAQITHPFILALFRLRSGMRLCSFDEGGYNVAPDGPFHRPRPPKVRRPRDAVALALFPGGTIDFVRRRTQRHYTAFPPERNVLSTLAEQIELPWASFVQPDEADRARSAGRIMVLPCLKDFTGSAQSREAILSAARTCDLVVRHPRDEAVEGLASLRLSSPVEGVICFAAEQRPVQVLHCASTVGLTLAGKPNIDLIDLCNGLPS